MTHPCPVCGNEVEKVNKGQQWVHSDLCNSILTRFGEYRDGEFHLSSVAEEKIKAIYQLHVAKI